MSIRYRTIQLLDTDTVNVKALILKHTKHNIKAQLVKLFTCYNKHDYDKLSRTTRFLPNIQNVNKLFLNI